jgi:hypothetical protein
MAKEIRMVSASADIAPLIDRGADVDTQIKNLTYEDKGIKARLGETASNTIQEGETSIRFKGEKSAAVVSAVEKLELNADAEDFTKVKNAVEVGLLDGIIEKEQRLAVPNADIERAAEILKKAGVNAMIAETFTINADSFKKTDLTDVSSEQGKARNALSKCVNKTVTYRVKYERV